jgi:hypothetical protein
MRNRFIVLALSLGLAARLAGQTEAETQRATLAGLRKLAVYARVQLPPGANLQPVDESALRSRMERALRRENISIDTRTDVRDGSQASVDLLYMVMEIRHKPGEASQFAASSCLQASQMVRIPRLTTATHIAYAVVSTWRSCGLLAGHTAGFGPSVLRNADEQIARFLEAWRRVNLPPPAPASPINPETRVSMELNPAQ